MMESRHICMTGRGVRFVIIVCWGAYSAINVGRYIFPASMGSIISEGIFTEIQMGAVSATFMLLYGLGQFASGLLADKVNPLYLMLISLGASAAVNLMMPFVGDFNLFYMLWSANALFQSLAWPGLTRLFSDLLDAQNCTKACVAMSSAGIFGMVVTYGGGSLVTYWHGWRTTFLLSGALLCLLTLIWLFFIRRVGLLPAVDLIDHKQAVHTAPNSPVRLNLGADALPVLLLIAVGCFLHGALKDGIFTWIPVYISETMNVKPAVSSALTMVIPAVSLAGIYLVKWISDKHISNELTLCSAAFGVAVAAILCLSFCSGRLILSVLFLACIGSVMSAINTIYLVFLPGRFRAVGKISTATGMLNAITYLGSGIGSFSYGVFSQAFGWGALHILWVGIAALGFIACFAARRKWSLVLNRVIPTTNQETA